MVNLWKQSGCFVLFVCMSSLLFLLFKCAGCFALKTATLFPEPLDARTNTRGGRRTKTNCLLSLLTRFWTCLSVFTLRSFFLLSGWQSQWVLTDLTVDRPALLVDMQWHSPLAISLVHSSSMAAWSALSSWHFGKVYGEGLPKHFQPVDQRMCHFNKLFGYWHL